MNFEKRFSEVAQSPQFAAIFQSKESSGNPFVKANLRQRSKKMTMDYNITNKAKQLKFSPSKQLLDDCSSQDSLNNSRTNLMQRNFNNSATRFPIVGEKDRAMSQSPE